LRDCSANHGAARSNQAAKTKGKTKMNEAIEKIVATERAVQDIIDRFGVDKVERAFERLPIMNWLDWQRVSRLIDRAKQQNERKR
jgi:ABC-type enterochelin transport system substrate-binding protein